MAVKTLRNFGRKLLALVFALSLMLSSFTVVATAESFDDDIYSGGLSYEEKVISSSGDDDDIFYDPTYGDDEYPEGDPDTDTETEPYEGPYEDTGEDADEELGDEPGPYPPADLEYVVTIVFDEDEDEELDYFFVTSAEDFDLLAGALAFDENDNDVEIFILDDGGFDIVAVSVHRYIWRDAPGL